MQGGRGTVGDDRRQTTQLVEGRTYGPLEEVVPRPHNPCSWCKHVRSSALCDDCLAVFLADHAFGICDNTTEAVSTLRDALKYAESVLENERTQQYEAV